MNRTFVACNAIKVGVLSHSYGQTIQEYQRPSGSSFTAGFAARSRVGD